MKNKQYLLSAAAILTFGGLLQANLVAAHTQQVHIKELDSGSSVQIKSDGSKYIQGEDGSTIQIERDGTKIIKKPDGTTVQVKPDGSKLIKTPDGATIQVPGNR